MDQIFHPDFNYIYYVQDSATNQTHWIKIYKSNQIYFLELDKLNNGKSILD